MIYCIFVKTWKTLILIVLILTFKNCMIGINKVFKVIFKILLIKTILRSQCVESWVNDIEDMINEGNFIDN